jgi:hypothetical protein
MNQFVYLYVIWDLILGFWCSRPSKAFQQFCKYFTYTVCTLHYGCKNFINLRMVRYEVLRKDLSNLSVGLFDTNLLDGDDDS